MSHVIFVVCSFSSLPPFLFSFFLSSFRLLLYSLPFLTCFYFPFLLYSFYYLVSLLPLPPLSLFLYTITLFFCHPISSSFSLSFSLYVSFPFLSFLHRKYVLYEYLSHPPILSSSFSSFYPSSFSPSMSSTWISSTLSSPCVHPSSTLSLTRPLLRQDQSPAWAPPLA